jgi:2-polyprenyl-3-methyl-5-hydroxy-6-metoxy-1,4-benzoquinol methylase
MRIFRRFASTLHRLGSGVSQLDISPKAPGIPAVPKAETEIVRITPEQLDHFIAESDRRGGPESPETTEYWKNMEYSPTVVVDKSLDPFGDEYLNQQLVLYTEISGRQLNQNENEHTHIDLDRHIAARNPYDHPDPTTLAVHVIRLCSAMRLAKAHRGARLLDMGCGWGLSSELASYLGFEVHALDINDNFIKLVDERSRRLKLGIKSIHSSFDEFATDEKFDMVLFYECLHHAVTPWVLLEKMARVLVDQGKILICGEPINEYWWPTWGLRLDPLSVYCIRKFGWFESGWSTDFILKCLDRALLNSTLVPAEDPLLGPIIVASKEKTFNAHWLLRNCSIDGAELNGQYIVTLGQFRMRFNTKPGDSSSELVLYNFRPKPIRALLQINNRAAVPIELKQGESRLPVGRIDAGDEIRLDVETWIPAEEISNNDWRRLGFHISGIQFV